MDHRAAERVAGAQTVRHLHLLVADVGPDVAAREMRKHVAWYIKGLPHSARVREQVNRTRAVDEMLALLRAYLEELESGGLESFGDAAGVKAADAAEPVVAMESGVAAG